MNLDKCYDFFKPELCRDRIHIIGCGAVGSTLAENLVRFGLTKITLYDFDTVEPHNITNQLYRQIDIGKPKTQALAEILMDINPEIKDDLEIEGRYIKQRLAGYVFLCVDNIDLRREIATANKTNRFIKAMFDFRMRLQDAQGYACRWDDPKAVQNFLNTMNFTHEEAKESTPRSACNVELNVVTTVRLVVAAGVDNFIEFIRSGGKELKKMILTDNKARSIMTF